LRRDDLPDGAVSTVLRRICAVAPPRLWGAAALSLLLHMLLLGTRLPQVRPEPETLRALSVIIAPPSPQVRPEKATRVAQADSEGGDRALRPSNARFARSPELPPKVAEAQQKVVNLERKVQELRQLAESGETPLSAPGAEPVLEPTLPAQQPQARPSFNRADLLSQGSRIARLETEIARDAETYQKRPRRKVFGATAVGVNYARYVEDWRLKVESIGNLNYPQVARDQNLSGTLRLLVALRSDGTIERIELERSSGHRLLDEAAERIVRLGAPYAPFPEALRRDTDVLEILRTWTFSREQRMHGESMQ
jgi:protein TonB